MGTRTSDRDRRESRRGAAGTDEVICPRCRVNQLGEKPIFLGPEGHICGDCWVEDRHAEMVQWARERATVLAVR